MPDQCGKLHCVTLLLSASNNNHELSNSAKAFRLEASYLKVCGSSPHNAKTLQGSLPFILN